MKYFEKLSDGIYAHTEGKTIGNVGMIVTETGNYIVDTSMYPTMARDIRIEAEAIGSGKITGALLTHYHLDHTGGNQVFHDVPIHSHHGILDNMKQSYDPEKLATSLAEREDADLFGEFDLTYPTKVFETNPYHPDDSEQVEITQIGGHTSGSSIIYVESENAIFAGDDLFAGLFPWGGDPSASPFDWLNACEFMIRKQPATIIPGHGPVQYNLKEVEYLQSYLKSIIATTTSLLGDNVTKEQAVTELAEIESRPEKSEGMKSRTLEVWYDKIKASL